MKALLSATVLTAILTLPAGDETASVARKNLHYLPQTLVELPVSDLPKSIRWYAETLGSEVTLDLTEVGWAEVTTPTEGFYLGLGQTDEGKEPAGTGGSKVIFATKDVDAARTWLLAKGVRAGDVYEIPDTVRLLEFEDPDGNALMFAQPLMQPDPK